MKKYSRKKQIKKIYKAAHNMFDTELDDLENRFELVLDENDKYVPVFSREQVLNVVNDIYDNLEIIAKCQNDVEDGVHIINTEDDFINPFTLEELLIEHLGYIPDDFIRSASEINSMADDVKINRKAKFDGDNKSELFTKLSEKEEKLLKEGGITGNYSFKEGEDVDVETELYVLDKSLKEHLKALKAIDDEVDEDSFPLNKSLKEEREEYDMFVDLHDDEESCYYIGDEDIISLEDLSPFTEETMNVLSLHRDTENVFKRDYLREDNLDKLVELITYQEYNDIFNERLIKNTHNDKFCEFIIDIDNETPVIIYVPYKLINKIEKEG